MTEPPARKSDLGVRAVSAVVMILVAGAALWLGGWYWTIFVGLIGLGVFFEWMSLVMRFSESAIGRLGWFLGGLVYLGIAVFTLERGRTNLDMPDDGLVPLWPHPTWYSLWPVLTLVLIVIAVDVGAYFAGRAIGGPKIAPRISPSKTWAGLGGGIVAAWLMLAATSWLFVSYIELCDYPGLCDFGPRQILMTLPVGIAFAVVAQAGDFFESWMKRRAGVKDSGKLLPGHGGLFDRTDGLIAVSFVVGLLRWLIG